MLDTDWSTIQPRTDLPMLRGRFTPTSPVVKLTVQTCGMMQAISHANVQLFLSQEINDGSPLTSGRVIPRGVLPGVRLYNIGSVWGDTASTAIQVMVLDDLRPGVPVAYELIPSIVGYCDQMQTAARPMGLAISPDDAHLYVACWGTSTLEKWELGRTFPHYKNARLADVDLGGERPVGPVLSADGAVALVATSRPGRLHSIDTAAMVSSGTIDLPADGIAAVAFADGAAWCAAPGRLVRARPPSGAVDVDVTGPTQPRALARTVGGDLFVTAGSGVSIHEWSSGEVIASTSLPAEPRGCSVNPVSGRVWVACADGIARGLDPVSLAVVAESEPVPGMNDVAVDRVGRTVFASADAPTAGDNFAYWDDQTGVIFDCNRLLDSSTRHVALSSDSFIYLSLDQQDTVWVFHGGTFFVRATSPFWCEHASLIAEGAVAADEAPVGSRAVPTPLDLWERQA